MSIKGFSVNGVVQRYDYTALDNLPQGQGVSDDLKAALLQLAQKVAYIDDQGQTYYDDLYDALYPEKTLLSIAANFQQGQAVVYNTDSLDSLKQYLTVTATYDDASTETVPSSAYTLSGTLTTGTSVITVTYEGKTDAFNVTVTAAPMSFVVTNNLTGCTTSNSATAVLENTSYTAVITASSGYTLVGATVSITMGGNDITTSAYSGGIITINSVTGALVISVAAVAVVLSSISAVYTQGNRTVFSNDSLDSLKPYLVVTATYSDSSTETVSADDYTLNGTLVAGTSTITVSYGGKTDTFDVTVTEFVIPSGYTRYDYIEKKTTSANKVAISNLIILNAIPNVHTLSLEAYLGKKTTGIYTGPATIGARPTSYNDSYAIYENEANGTWGIVHNSVFMTHTQLPSNRLMKLEIINPLTSPYYYRVDGGELSSVEWTETPTVQYGFMLFNNAPQDTPSGSLDINTQSRVGTLIFRKSDGECVGYYIPCVYSGKIGMYDIISETFYTAATAAAVTISNSGCLYAVGNL